MNAYLIESQRRISPFGDHPRDCLIVNRRLGELQKEAIQSLGLTLIATPKGTPVQDAGEHLIFADNLYFTKELLEEFITRSRELKRGTVCALKPGVTTLRSVVATQEVKIHPDRVEYDLRYLPAREAAGEPVPVVIDPDRFSEAIPMPEHMFGASHYHVPMTDLLLVQIDHWANLWASNIATLLAGGAKLKKASKIRLLALALKARSLNQWKVLSKLNVIGRNCDIHPTAYIEGSVLGDNVQVGAGSVIRESMVGEGTFIGNNVTMEVSVAGEKCNIRNGAVVQFAVLYPGTLTMARLISISLCGRNTFLGDGVTLSDFRLDRKPITVMKENAPVDTGNTFIGCCLGHGAYLGAGCVVAPGRAIPNGARISPDEQRIIRKCPPQGDFPGHRQI